MRLLLMCALNYQEQANDSHVWNKVSHCIVVNLETDYRLDESTVPRESNLIKKKEEKSSQQVQQNQPIRCLK